MTTLYHTLFVDRMYSLEHNNMTAAPVIKGNTSGFLPTGASLSISKWRLRELKNLNFGGYSRRVKQSGACSSSDVITSGGRKSKTTMEDKLIVAVCGYPELYDTTSYFYKNRNKFCNETGAAWLKRSPSHDANSRLLCSEFHARMKRISRANETNFTCE